MKKYPLSLVAFVVITTVFLSSCSVSKGIVEYRKFNMYTAANAGNMKYEELIPITESASGFVWDSCDKVASDVATIMFDRAKAAGGNALMNVKWFAENGSVTTPTCKTGYGWFALFIAGGLGPWVKSASAEASIIKLNEDALKDTSFIQNNQIVPLYSKSDLFVRLQAMYNY